MKFTPVDVGGGTPVGVSYMSLWRSCRRKWLYSHYYPTVVADTHYLGLVPKATALPLLSGSMFHEGIAAWLASGCVDGEDTGCYSLDAAIEAIDNHWRQRRIEYRDDETAEEDRLAITSLMRQYDDYYGPKGLAPDWPDLHVLCDDDGQPIVERQLTIPLDYGGYYFTTRIDAAVSHMSFFKIMEHKTSGVQYAGRRLNTIHLEAQFTGELMALLVLFPEEPLNGVLVNVIAKNRGPRSKVPLTSRDTTTRSSLEIERFKRLCQITLQEIDDTVGAFDSDLKQGYSLDEAIDKNFPPEGMMNSNCHTYNRECDFAGFCTREDHGRLMGAFRARSADENKRFKEWA